MASSKEGHVAAIDNGLSTHRLNLRHDFLCRGQVAGTTELVAAEIVDDNLGAVFGHHDGVITADAAACAGDESDLALEKLAHIPSGVRTCRNGQEVISERSLACHGQRQRLPPSRNPTRMR